MPGRPIFALALLHLFVASTACEDEDGAVPASPTEPAASLEEVAAEPEPEPEPPAPALPTLAVDELERVRDAHHRDPALDAVRMRTTASLSLREGPSADDALIRILPEGTIVVAFHGSVDGHASEPGGRGKWSQVAASGADLGWCSSRFLSADDEPLPTTRALIGALGSTVPASDVGRLVVSRISASDGQPGFFTVVELDAGDAPVSRIAFLRLLNATSVALLSEHHFAGVLESGRVVEEMDLMVSYRETREPAPRTLTHWTVFRGNQAQPVWDDELPTDESWAAPMRARVRVPAENASGPCAFAVDMPVPQFERLDYPHGGELCRHYHTRHDQYVVAW